MTGTRTNSFTAFARDTEPRLRRALVAALGADLAADALAETMTYAWQNWERVEQMENPGGYLYKVARNQASRLSRREPVLLPRVPEREAP